MADDGNNAVSAMAACWVLTALVFVFLLLRVYTRLHFVSVYGADDLFYLMGFVSDT